MAPLGGAPRLVLLFSGKRKSGKDFVTEALQSRLGGNICAVLRLSGPLKEQYARWETSLVMWVRILLENKEFSSRAVHRLSAQVNQDPQQLRTRTLRAQESRFLVIEKDRVIDGLYFGQEHDLDFQRLLDASTYKEAHRRDMIRWGEEKRQADPGFFCRKIVEGVSQPIWLVSDTRRVSDIQWFQEAYGAVTQTVRVVASEQSRQQRGWVFTPGVDDAESECGLDNFGDFDWVIENHGDEQCLEDQLGNLLECIHGRL